MDRARALGLSLCLLLQPGCRESYRVGEYVLVQWCDAEYPAYVIALKGRTRYRVHFEGYDRRWDTEVGFDEIKTRLEAPPKVPPPMCERVAQALGIKKPEDNKLGLFKVGTRVRVTWRGSVYKAIVLDVPAPDRYRVHYEGYETSWDEEVGADRIVGIAK